MIQRLIPALLTIGLLTSPAFAQTAGQNNQNATPPTSGNSSSKSSASSTSSMDPAQVEQHIHQDLTKAGYSDVHVMPGSFLVQAKDSQGNLTQMMITPGGITEVTALQNTNSNGSNSGSTSSNKQ